MPSTYVGEGVRRALWQLVLAMVFKALITNVLHIAVIIKDILQAVSPICQVHMLVKVLEEHYGS